MPFIINERLGTLAKNEMAPRGWKVINAMDIPDGICNPLRIYDKIREACVYLNSLDEKTKVMFRCHAGMSRSNGLAVGVLVEFFGMSFEDAIVIVNCKVPRALMCRPFLYSVKVALTLFKPSRIEEYWGERRNW